MQHITRVWHDVVPAPGSVNAQRMASDASSARSAEQGLGQPCPSAQPTVSVVLVARAGHAELTRALEALANQTYPAHLLEVVAVCASTDESTARAVAALARRRPGLRLHFVSCAAERSLGAARNCGWRRATGSIVGFTTDAVVPAPGWVESAIEAFDPWVDIVSGQVVVPLRARPSVPQRRAMERLQSPWTTRNIFYRRSLLRELDGFDEAYAHWGHDETDLIFTALSAGARFCAAEGAIVVHDQPGGTWREELLRQMPHADDARLYRKHPNLCTQFVRPASSTLEYLSLAALCGVFVCAATRHRFAAGMATALWATSTLVQVRFAARDTSDDPRDLLALLLAIAALPPVTVLLRLYGAIRHKMWIF